jgi:spore photoproduct lyase
VRRFVPEKIFIEAAAADFPLTRQILSRCPETPRETIPDARQLIAARQAGRLPGYFEKKTLLLCLNRGRFLEPCPGTRHYRCCGYMILTPGIGCPLDCSYCVLQAYLNNPFVTLYVNLEDMVDELAAAGDDVVRIGTGEFMDSLALDHLTDFSLVMLPFLKARRGISLELKTKTTNIDNLLDLDHQGRYIVSWSLNAAEAAADEEHGAAPMHERIAAARRLVDRGYRVGFHFDPLLYYPGWETGYRETVSLLAERIPPQEVAWISIGSLRYMPHLKKTGQIRFPATKIYTGEFVPGFDGKMRYLQDMRIELYTQMVTWLREYSQDVFIYFCMESEHVWQRALGFAPASNSGLKKLLETRTTTP